MRQIIQITQIRNLSGLEDLDHQVGNHYLSELWRDGNRQRTQADVYLRGRRRCGAGQTVAEKLRIILERENGQDTLPASSYLDVHDVNKCCSEIQITRNRPPSCRLAHPALIFLHVD